MMPNKDWIASMSTVTFQLKLSKSKLGYSYFCVKDTKVILYLTEDLLPNDSSLQVLAEIAEKFKVEKQLVALPDLHFKVKNFVPSGMAIPLQNEFSPKLLGPNNDSIAALKVRVSSGCIKQEVIAKVFSRIKSAVEMFRRNQSVATDDTVATILQSGIRRIASEWGFGQRDVQRFEDHGCVKEFATFGEVEQAFPTQRSALLPDFVPDGSIIERGAKCLGVLDGTSHFVELFQAIETLQSNCEQALDIKTDDFFFLVHAGSADIGLLSHRAYLGQGDDRYSLEEESGIRAYNAFAVAGNFGFANRLYIFKLIKEIVEEELTQLEGLEVFSDLPHDYVELKPGGTCLHRKGAVKIMPNWAEDLPSEWRVSGAPYVFPSCAGGDAYIVSNSQGKEESFYTISHGVGRLLVKDEAIDRFRNVNFKGAMQHETMLFRYGVDTIEGQNPAAFKSIDRVLEMFKRFALADPITKLKPIASLKG